jgi:O-acetyl-ADP-ribose deacetylase (regulator of RNase III)
MPLEVVAEYRCDGLRIEVWKGDITEAECEAVVNPANSLMIMGGGVAGALRRAAGESVEAEARRHAPVPVGEAIHTGAGRLEPRIRYIIHAPTMERPAMRTTESKVLKAAKAALKEAEKLKVSCIAFPAMGAGVGGLSAKESIRAMMQALDEFLQEGGKPPARIVFVAYLDRDARHFIEELGHIKLRSCRLEKAASETPQ